MIWLTSFFLFDYSPQYCCFKIFSKSYFFYIDGFSYFFLVLIVTDKLLFSRAFAFHWQFCFLFSIALCIFSYLTFCFSSKICFQPLYVITKGRFATCTLVFISGVLGHIKQSFNSEVVKVLYLYWYSIGVSKVCRQIHIRFQYGTPMFWWNIFFIIVTNYFYGHIITAPFRKFPFSVLFERFTLIMGSDWLSTNNSALSAGFKYVLVLKRIWMFWIASCSWCSCNSWNFVGPTILQKLCIQNLNYCGNLSHLRDICLHLE